ncbi:hypothetical protein L484_026025 [Morus notabilis]|uniref:Pentatricopeptide repeat-containing protein n=1 Tax=Morus notabilis TaxID=981085 RepID=W9RWE0_9ROSA|nr:pentatricopeptide repeat-containing protein At3g13150 [Morus notabilis]EXB75243.1 hypothetical protein L484_026025 [Morus notabilis]
MSAVNRRLGIFTKSFSAIASTTKNDVTVKSLATKASSHETQLQNLVDKFKTSCESQRFRHNQSIYRRKVRRLAAANKFSMIEDILEHQKKYDDIRREGFSIRLIGLYGEAGMFDHAHKVFDELPELNCDRTVKSLNALLKAALDAKKFDKVIEIFNELPSRVSIEPDMISYNIVIHAFCEMGSLDEALSLFRKLEDNGQEPDLVTFNTLLNALYMNNRFSEGERIWATMESKNVVPDVRSYNSRLRGMFRDNRISEAEKLVGEMESNGIRSDVFSYNALIKGFCDSGNLEEAKKWYGEIEKNKCTPNLATYIILIPAFRKAGDLDKAFELCLDANNHGFFLKRTVFKQVAEALVEKGRTEEASELENLVRA